MDQTSRKENSIECIDIKMEEGRLNETEQDKINTNNLREENCRQTWFTNILKLVYKNKGKHTRKTKNQEQETEKQKMKKDCIKLHISI